jgi:hypothetical protein
MCRPPRPQNGAPSPDARVSARSAGASPFSAPVKLCLTIRLSWISGRSGHRPSWLSDWADDGLFTFGSFSTLAPPLSHALPGCAALRVTRELGHSVTLSCVLQEYFRRMHMEAPYVRFRTQLTDVRHTGSFGTKIKGRMWLRTTFPCISQTRSAN